jgi:hypothetical protein
MTKPAKNNVAWDALSEIDDALGRIKLQHRMVRSALVGVQHDPCGDGASDERSIECIYHAMLDVETTLDEIHAGWLKAHIALGGAG